MIAYIIERKSPTGGWMLNDGDRHDISHGSVPGMAFTGHSEEAEAREQYLTLPHPRGECRITRVHVEGDFILRRISNRTIIEFNTFTVEKTAVATLQQEDQ